MACVLIRTRHCKVSGCTYSKELGDIGISDGVDTSEDLLGWDCLDVEGCDNSVVAASTFQSPEKIWQVALGGVGNAAISEDNFVLDDVVT